jgi:hypothetical protein
MRIVFQTLPFRHSELEIPCGQAAPETGLVTRGVSDVEFNY